MPQQFNKIVGRVGLTPEPDTFTSDSPVKVIVIDLSDEPADWEPRDGCYCGLCNMAREMKVDRKLMDVLLGNKRRDII
jgi:hypothetical protein